jgi:hypothetical protein
MSTPEQEEHRAKAQTGIRGWCTRHGKAIDRYTLIFFLACITAYTCLGIYCLYTLKVDWKDETDFINNGKLHGSSITFSSGPNPAGGAAAGRRADIPPASWSTSGGTLPFNQ